MARSTFSGAEAERTVSGAVARLGGFDPAAMVRERVRLFRARGRKNAEAISLAASELGLSERAVRGLLYGEVRAALSESYAAL